MDNPSTVGENLIRYRELRSVTQVELSEAAGIPQQSISAYERGLRQPKFPALVRLAAALDCEPRDLDPTLGLPMPPEILALQQCWPLMDKKDRNEFVKRINEVMRKYKSQVEGHGEK